MAEPVADFYKGKTVSLVVGYDVGTGFDVYGRVVARHLGRHIPGNPSIVVQNMVGASGIVAANWLYNVAPRDGTVLATFSPTVPSDPLYGGESGRFEAAKFSWIGNIAESSSICGISKISEVDAVKGLLAKPAVFGATAATGTLAKFTHAVKHLLDARITLVSGYKGSADLKIAMQRREIDGTCGLPFSTVTSFWRDDYESGAFRVILRLNGKPNRALQGIPLIDDFARTEEERQVIGLIFGVHAFGRLFASAPGIPVERRNALRNALMAMTKDPQFLADAAKTNIDIDATSGGEVEQFIARVYASPPSVVERAKRALGPD